MIKNVIFSLQPMLIRSFPLRTISITQPFFSDDIWNKNIQLQVQQLVKRETEAVEFKTMVDNKTKRWKEQYEIYYGKERDLVNYPMLKQPLYSPKLRFPCIPDEWFQSFYTKTGVTGPYLMMWGVLMTLVSKEMIVWNHYFNLALPTITAIVIIHKKAGAHANKFYKAFADKKIWLLAVYPKQSFSKMANGAIETAKTNQATCDVVIDFLQAAKDNVGLQLETVYRSRVATVHRDVKKRLDYLVEKEVSKLRYQKQHMLDWIVNCVIKDFTAEQEKATLAQCINDLKSLARA